MNAFEQAVADRREQIAQLQREIEALEFALSLTDSKPVRATGGARQPAAPRLPPARRSAEPPALPKNGPRRRTRPGDPTFARCGHTTGAENQTNQGKCKTCKNASQLAYLAKKAGKAPKTKAEPDPVAVKSAAIAAPANPVAIANAAKWQTQCTLLNFENGQRCSLMKGHEGLHSASGRTFKTGLNPADLGGTVARPARELDQHALRGGGNAKPLHRNRRRGGVAA